MYTTTEPFLCEFNGIVHEVIDHLAHPRRITQTFCIKPGIDIHPQGDPFSWAAFFSPATIFRAMASRSMGICSNPIFLFDLVITAILLTMESRLLAENNNTPNILLVDRGLAAQQQVGFI